MENSRHRGATVWLAITLSACAPMMGSSVAPPYVGAAPKIELAFVEPTTTTTSPTLVLSEAPPQAARPTTTTTTATTMTASATTTTVAPGNTTTTAAPAAAAPPAAAGTCTNPKGVTMPAGAVRIDPGTDIASVVSGHGPNTTFWLAAGTHRVRSAITTKSGDRILGASGAVLDGAWGGTYAAIAGGDNVTIEGLVVQRFGVTNKASNANAAILNRTAADGWHVTDTVVRDIDGIGLFVGSNSIVEASCFEKNGQNGVAAPRRGPTDYSNPVVNARVERSAFFNNGRDDGLDGACGGCSSAMKFWATTTIKVTDNLVESNRLGIWFDTNNADSIISGNELVSNDGPGVMIETSYNAQVLKNTFRKNSLVRGAARTDPFPDAGLYISESGGDSRVPGSATFTVDGNTFDGDYNAITVWENPDRFCGSVADESIGSCSRASAYTATQCEQLAGTHPSAATFAQACRWLSQNIVISANRFVNPPTCTQAWCARISLVSLPFGGTLKFRTGASISTGWPQDVITSRLSTSAVVRNNSFQGTWFASLGTPYPRLAQPPSFSSNTN